MSRNYELLPTDDLKGALERYIEEGYMPGHFVTAVLENNLFEAIRRADDVNILLIPLLCTWIWNEAPTNCWGSPAKVRAYHLTFWPE
jgi:hypothetical protein